MSAPLVLYHCPRTRAFTTLWLLEELEVPYVIEHVSLKTGAHKSKEHLARNPMGKVPAVRDGDVVVSETAAIALYLTDRYAMGCLAPALDDPQRADYLRWVVFPGVVMEPAFGEKFFKWQVPSGSVGWGSYADMVRVLEEGLSGGKWLLGDRFTAADVLVASCCNFGQLFGALPKEGVIFDYVARAILRPSFARAQAKEEAELAAHGGPR